MRGTYNCGYLCLNSNIDVVWLDHVASFLQEGSQMLAAAKSSVSCHFIDHMFGVGEYYSGKYNASRL